MFVKSLTLRGFKSFASATTLRLEPGITCVVGPNGSGKSNVVDALAWVMGEQGAKTLRGAKMEDVIFAGTSGRPPLGRAEVALTIDNSDGALPIDYAEVTITRTMFRSGGSDYSLNGTPCRLLDIQELLSDSGIGHEMHVIVGQGQLDAVLRATPEERRGFIEEAAGVLKHRKRKERALRKLDAMEANLTRVADLTGEIRRQLGPLGRQAEAARTAAVTQAEARDARLRLLADDLVALTSALEQEVADEAVLLARRAETEQALEGVRARLAAGEAQAARETALLARAQQRWFGLSSLRDRLEGTGRLASERARLLADDRVEERHGADPEQLRSQAARLRLHEAELEGGIRDARQSLERATGHRLASEAALADEQQRLARSLLAAADRREGLATLAGQVAAGRSRIEAGEAEIGRLRESARQSSARAAEAEREFALLESCVASDEDGEQGLDAAYEDALGHLRVAEGELARLHEAERRAERETAGLASRLEALESQMGGKQDGASVLLSEVSARKAGVVGLLATLVRVDAGHEAAVAAALGWAADGVVVGSLDDAHRALALLHEHDAGRAALLVAGPPHLPAGRASSGAEPPLPGLPREAVWALDAVTFPEELGPLMHRLLRGVALVPDDAAALSLLHAVAEGAEVTAVTRAGDVYAAGFVRGEGASAPTLIEARALVERTRGELSAATLTGERLRFALGTAHRRVSELKVEAEQRLSRLHESDARMAALAERLGQLGGLLRSARAEAHRTAEAIATAEGAVAADRVVLARLQQRLEAAEGQPGEVEPSTAERDRIETAVVAARAAETELLLRLRTHEERAEALAGRAQSLDAAADTEVEARRAAAVRRDRRVREAQVARAVASGAAYAALVISGSLERAERERAAAERERLEWQEALARLRLEIDDLAEQLRLLTDSVHRDEVARTQQQVRIEALQAKAVEENGIDPDALVQGYGPHQPVPVLADAPAEDGFGETQPYVRELQEKRLRAAERKLALLGRINPLALEEYAALEERHAFLTAQMEDLRASRRDLLDIVREVDERVEAVFTEAFHDTAAQFERVFGRLFPGGEGRLVLTDPDDMLTTGIEVEARPPGKRIKRLSLLSGGERSLTAIALLVAIFKARPSPFYVLDEVEAALDETNLGRLLVLFEELRDSSQLIVITHQKHTMELADALYGVTMRGDGVTTVVSQRVRDVQSA